MPPKNESKPPVNTGYPQPANAGYPQTVNAGYPQTVNAGYPQTANAGYPQTVNAGYPQTANAGYPQPANAGYPQPANAGGGVPTFNTTQPVQNVVSETQLGPEPITITCKSCNQQIVTRVEQSPSIKTHLIAVVICLVFWPCAFLPYCIPFCQNATHSCPNCNAYIGKYNF